MWTIIVKEIKYVLLLNLIFTLAHAPQPLQTIRDSYFQKGTEISKSGNIL